MFITESDMKTLAKTHNTIFVFMKTKISTDFPQNLLADESIACV